MSEIATGQWRKSACILCSLNCGLEVQTGGKDGREILKVRGDKSHPGSEGYLCEKSQKLNYYQNGKDRLQTPLRRRPDGSFEAVSWDVAIAEIAARFKEIQRKYGGDKILYYGGGGQGNHLGGTYGDSTLKALGVKYRSNALAQEKTGEFWVQGKMIGAGVHGDFEHAAVSVFIGKNPWQSHGFARARVILKAIQKDPNRISIVIDPRRSESAQRADIHLALKPGTDAWLLSALAATLVQESRVNLEWVEAHTDGYALVKGILEKVDIARAAAICGLEEGEIRRVARIIAEAESCSFFEDLGLQMNRNSTLGSYLQRLIWLLSGHFAKKGCNNAFVPFLSLSAASKGQTGKKKRPQRRKKKVTPVTQSKIIIGLMPCNVIPDEILTDHPDRFRAMLIESGNPVHSIADSQRMREAMAALEFSVVIDVAMTETARQAHYILPAASQFEKAECTYFNIEFPRNTFHLRHRLFEPLPGTLSEAEIHTRLVMALKGISEGELSPLKRAARWGKIPLLAALGAMVLRHPDRQADIPILLYRALGPLLPKGAEEGAVLWILCHLYAKDNEKSLRQAGFTGAKLLLGERLFEKIIQSQGGVVFADATDYGESWDRVTMADKRIQLALPELFEDWIRLSYETPPVDTHYPYLLSAGERRSDTTNTIVRNPEAKRKLSSSALRISVADGAALSLKSGDLVRLKTRRGQCEVAVEITDTLQAGHLSLPNGFGLDYDSGDGPRRFGVAPNELTDGRDRDPIAGTPWHKSVPAQLEPLEARPA